MSRATVTAEVPQPVRGDGPAGARPVRRPAGAGRHPSRARRSPGEHDLTAVSARRAAADAGAAARHAKAMPAGRRAHPDVSATITARRGRGASLPDGVRAEMAHALGDPMLDVRVHTDAPAHALTRSVAARAFTTGSDVFFAKGEYQPATSTGKRLLAHELAHVVQQRGAPQSGELLVSEPGDALEHEAERVAQAIVGGGARLDERHRCGAARMLQRDQGSDDYRRGYDDGLSGRPAAPGPLNDEPLVDYNEGYQQGRYELAQQQPEPAPLPPSPDQEPYGPPAPPSADQEPYGPPAPPSPDPLDAGAPQPSSPTDHPLDAGAPGSAAASLGRLVVGGTDLGDVAKFTAVAPVTASRAAAVAEEAATAGRISGVFARGAGATIGRATVVAGETAAGLFAELTLLTGVVIVAEVLLVAGGTIWLAKILSEAKDLDEYGGTLPPGGLPAEGPTPAEASDRRNPRQPRRVAPDEDPQRDPETAPRPESKRDPRDDCLYEHPTYLPFCDDRPKEAVAAGFARSGGIVPKHVRCETFGSGPADARANPCGTAPSEYIQCTINKGPIVVSMFGCFCCDEDGSVGRFWDGVHQSSGPKQPGAGRRPPKW